VTGLPPPRYLAEAADTGRCRCGCGCDRSLTRFPYRFARQARRAQRSGSLHSRATCPACLAGEHLTLRPGGPP
jgi:hypothetical protein